MPDAQSHTNRLQALAESAEMFAEASTDLKRLLDVVARCFSDLVGDACNIRLIEGDELVPAATRARDPKVDAYLAEAHDSTRLKLGDGISGNVIATGEPFFRPSLDITQLREVIAPAFMPIFEKIGMRGMIVARLRARGVNLGYLSLFRIDPARPPYTEADLLLVKDLADRAALAIDTSRLLAGLEKRVAERTEALETANRELEAFAFSVSHDLRSPLRAIDGYSRLLEDDYGPQLDDDARRMLGTVRKNAQHMSRLIEELLRLSRLGHRAIQPVREIAMRELVDAVIAGVRAANPTQTLEFDIGELPAVAGNSELLRQVWTNLIENAVKYSRKRDVARVEIAGQRKGSELQYTITDHGAGFDPRYADKLFGVFQRLHSEAEFPGTGVGLALVKRIVTRHGGRVWAEGGINEGATFGFALPERSPHSSRS